ncbi:MAG: hypothetical protein ACREK6_20595, partial [Candidatus Rokuibacteriota bacterium]
SPRFMRSHAIIALIRDGHDAVGANIDSAMHARPLKETALTPGGMNKIEPLPRDLEIQLALSALPPHLRDNATVYILNPERRETQ